MFDEALPCALLLALGERGTSLLVAAALFSLLALLAFAWRRAVHAGREARKLRAILDAIDAPVVVTDPDLTIVDANGAARSVLGPTRRGARRSKLKDVLQADGNATIDHTLETLEKEGGAAFEAQVGPAGKAARHVRVRLRRIEVPAGSRVVALLEDISSERAQFAHYERFLDYLIRNVPLEVAILSPDGRYQYLSSAFLADADREAWLIGKTDFDYCRESGLHTELALRRRSHRMEAIDRGETVSFDEEIVFDGESRHVSWRYVPFGDEEGEVMMVLGFGLDVTELVDRRRELYAARRESEKASRLKEALLQNVSHEVRTPLSSIIATAQMLRSEVDPGLRDFVQNLEVSARRLSDTLNGMLDLAGLQAENIDVRPVILDAASEVEEVVRSLRPAAERRGLFLEFAASEPEILIRADRDALARCVQSLVDNAIKFTPEGGVAVDVSQRGEHAFLRVMDTGVGIESEASSEVFEAFQQEEAGMDRSFEGAGLGLALTERLVRLMDGEIRMHSRKGAGSSFVVRLPLVMPRMRGRGGHPRHVLVADPQKETYRLAAHVMRDVFSFDHVHRPAEMEEVPVDRRYDFVLVDARLDGERTSSDLHALLRAAPFAADATLIFMDHDPRGRRRGELLQEGWDEVITKPLTRVALVNALYVDADRAAAGRVVGAL